MPGRCNLLHRVYLLQTREFDKAQPREAEVCVENIHHVAGSVCDST